MSESKMAFAMGAIMLILIFGGFMAYSIVKVGGFLDKKSGRVTIEDTDSFGQLVLYNTLVAYNCNDKGGGHIEYNPYGADKKAWDDWQSFESRFGFSELKDSSPGQLTCSGTHVTLPLTNKGIWSSIGQAAGVSSKEWRNDQEGRYSRMKFRINQTIQIGDGGMNACLGANGPHDVGHKKRDSTFDTKIMFTDPKSEPWFEWNPDLSPVYNCENIFGSRSVTLDGSEDGGGSEGGAEYNVHVLSLASDYDSMYHGPSGWQSSGWSTSFHPYTFCEGTLGYIQSNNGQPNKYNNINAYTPLNPPGYPNKEQPGHEIDDNTVHTFIVITKNGCA